MFAIQDNFYNITYLIEVHAICIYCIYGIYIYIYIYIYIFIYIYLYIQGWTKKMAIIEDIVNLVQLFLENRKICKLIYF